MADSTEHRTSGQPSQQRTKQKSDSNGKKSGKKNRWRSSQSSTTKKKNSTFKGAITELNGHVFEIHSESSKSTQFQRTIDELCMYMARKYDFGGDMVKMINDAKEIDFDQVKPKYPSDDQDKTDMEIWRRLVEKHVDRMSHYAPNKDALFMII